MKRRNFKAIITDHTGLEFYGETSTFAWNSAIKASESLVRERARSEGVIYTGAKPRVIESQYNVDRMEGGKIYTRTWTSPDGKIVDALVWEVV
jgi:hypothetical protein